MHDSIKRYENIVSLILSKLEEYKTNKKPKIIAVSKTFNIEKIIPLIDIGHLDFGENKVQEAIDKWSKIKLENQDIKLHLIGKLQSNKVKLALKIFDFIHSLDSEKLAKKIFDEQEKQSKKVKIFIQVNIGNEKQKSGVSTSSLPSLYSYCKDLKLDVIGLMCIPPVNESKNNYFKEMNNLNINFGFNELSMGMSADYLDALENSATYLRIGSSIFGQRS